MVIQMLHITFNQKEGTSCAKVSQYEWEVYRDTFHKDHGQGSDATLLN